LAPILLLLAPIMLIIDLEQPPRFWHLFLYLNLKSPITYGSFLLTLYPINGLIYAWFLFKGNARLAKILGLIGIPLAIATHGYTGFILALGKEGFSGPRPSCPRCSSYPPWFPAWPW